MRIGEPGAGSEPRGSPSVSGTDAAGISSSDAVVAAGRGGPLVLGFLVWQLGTGPFLDGLRATSRGRCWSRWW